MDNSYFSKSFSYYDGHALGEHIVQPIDGEFHGVSTTATQGFLKLNEGIIIL